jgi:GxxExxY protein
LNHKDTKTQRNPVPAKVNELSGAVVNAAFTVHKKLGRGLLESVYEVCLAYELGKIGLKADRQVEIPVIYDNTRLEAGLRIDLLVENSIVVELKAVEQLLPVHEAQILTYLKLTGHRLGLLINFNVTLIRDGIKRFVL